MRTLVIGWSILGLLVGCGFDAQGLGSAGTGSSSDDGSPAGTSTGPHTTGPAPGTTTTPNDTTHADDTTHDTTGAPPDDTTTGPSTEGTSSTSDTGHEDGSPTCGGPRWWEADFSADPTTLDVDGDLTLDWSLRDLSPFPVEQLGGGVWASTPGVVLDTRPLDDFQGRTLAWVRMRNTQVGSGRGAVMWLNVGYDAVRFAPIYASLMLQADGTQQLAIVNSPSGPTPLLELSGLGAGMVEITLDIDVDTEQVEVLVDGAAQGTFPLVFRDRNGNDDRWATLIAWDTTAEFDAVRVERCP